jgi:serine/threonine protein kinase
MSIFSRRISEAVLAPIHTNFQRPRAYSVRPTVYESQHVQWNVIHLDELYLCLKRLGVGAQATAFLLSDKRLPTKQVVAKIYQDTDENRRVVSNEIKVLKHLNRDGCKPFLLCFQRNFVTPREAIPNFCHTVIKTSTALVVIYDYFFGPETQTLDSLFKIKRNPQGDEERSLSQHLLRPDIQLQIVYTLIRSVAFLHANDVAHLDIKPANVIINVKTGRIQLIDFGFSCMEQYCIPSGTPTHIAPEVARIIGRRQPRSTITGSETTPHILPIQSAMKADAWSIGVLLTELIHDSLPYKFHTVQDESYLTPVAWIYHVGKLTESDMYGVEFIHDIPEIGEMVSDIVSSFTEINPNLRLDVQSAFETLSTFMPSSPAMSSPLSPLQDSPMLH